MTYLKVVALPAGCLRCACVGLAALILAAPVPASTTLGLLEAVDLPAGTALEVRLLTAVSSYSSKVETDVEALVIAPGCPDGLPAGTIVRGIVKRVQKVGLGLVHESARMELEFRELLLPNGQNFPLLARVTKVDNARERVDSHGSIRGARATASISHRMSSKLAFGAVAHPLFLIPIFVVETAMFRFPNPEIEFSAGTELFLQVENSVSMGATPACPVIERRAGLEESAELRDIIDNLPRWTYSKRGSKPTDPTNLMFLGSQQDIERAFAAAGWVGAQSISRAAGLQAVRAFAETRGFADAPMRTLLLDGAEPDISRQKALNTFAKRHHLRIWKRADEWHGQTVWASAATRDMSAGLSLRPFGVTHYIQNEVDLERDKVVSDLVFTGCTESVSYFNRPEDAPGSPGPGRKGVKTDSRIAVIELNSCQSPREGPVVATENRPIPLVVRSVRRVTLSARNHLLRDHLVWSVGEVAWMGIRSLHGSIEEHLVARRAQALARNQTRARLALAELRSAPGGN